MAYVATTKVIQVTDFEDYKPGVTDFAIGAAKLGWYGVGDATDYIEVKGKKHDLKFVRFIEQHSKKLYYLITIGSISKFKEAEKFRIYVDFTK